MSPQHPAPLLSTPIDSTALLSEGLSTKDCIIFYVGGESLALTNFLLTHSSSEVCVIYVAAYTQYRVLLGNIL